MPQLRRSSTAVLLAACCGLVVAFVPSLPLRVIAGTTLLLVLPGFVFARALLRGEKWPERLLVTLGGSAVIVALLALFLDMIRVPLERATWAAALGLLVAVGSIAAGGVRSEPDRSAWPVVRRVDALFLAIAAAALTAALFIGTKPLRAPAATPGYAALWVEPQGARGAVAVVGSGTFQPGTFRLVVAVNGRVVASKPHIAISPGEEYRFPIPAPLRRGSRVTALLDRLGERPAARQRAELTVGETVRLASAEARS
jgi:hypothetical protein